MTIRKTLQQNAAWIFFALGVFILAGVSAYLYAVETKSVQTETNRVADATAESIQTNARLLFRDLRTFTELGHFVTKTTNASTQAAITTFVQDRGTPFVYLEAVDQLGRPTYTYSQDPTQTTSTQSTIDTEKKRVLQTVQSSNAFAISSPIDLPNGESALIFATPLTFDDASPNNAIGVIPISYFYDALTTVCSETGYHFAIMLPQGAITRLPEGLCVIEPVEASTQTSPWLNATRSILVGNETWNILITHPSFQFRFMDVGSTIPFSIGGFLIILVITSLIYRIQRNREQLEQALERENEFVSIVSHQLREPVSQMNAFIELLEDAWPPDAGKKSRDILEDLHVINQGNARLIANLLNVSRLQRGVLKPSIQGHVLKDLVEASLKKTDASRNEQQVTVQVKPTGMASMVLVDERLASDVIQNILDNAYKYSPKKSELTIKADASSSASFIVLAITDKGPGIPAALQGSLFSKDRPRGAKTSGSGAGLGLYIAKKFMNMMGGDIRFKTSSKGTTFFLSFPKAS